MHKPKSPEQWHLENLERIRQFRLIDDDFLNVCFAENIRDTEFILQILLNRSDLHVQSVVTQETLKNLHGRSLRLDIKAVDSTNRIFNIEVQRADKGASPKRARYHGSLLDTNLSVPGTDFEQIPEVYIVFITESDYYGYGNAIYQIDRSCHNPIFPFEDGMHILYVNGRYRGNDEIGRLMHDFCTSDPDTMYHTNLAQTARYYKTNKKGVSHMCEIMEEMKREAAFDSQFETRFLDIQNLMDTLKISADQAMDALKIPLSERHLYLE